MPTWPRPQPKPRQDDPNRPSAAERGYDSRWAKFARWYKRVHPLCNRCGRVTDVPHHKTPLDEGGEQYELSNIEPLCRKCHEAHHGRMKAVVEFYEARKGDAEGFKP